MLTTILSPTILSHLLCINLGFLGGWFVLKALILKSIRSKLENKVTIHTLLRLKNEVYNNMERT